MAPIGMVAPAASATAPLRKPRRLARLGKIRSLDMAFLLNVTIRRLAPVAAAGRFG
jgi:hypothetical protein